MNPQPTAFYISFPSREEILQRFQEHDATCVPEYAKVQRAFADLALLLANRRTDKAVLKACIATVVQLYARDQSLSDLATKTLKTNMYEALRPFWKKN